MPDRPKIIYYVEPDPAALARRAAQHFVEMATEAVHAHGRVSIAISGGSTPKATFALLADHHQPWFSRMPWDLLDLYWVDERCVPPGHPDSNYTMTCETMLSHVPLPSAQIHRILGEEEPHVAAALYESELRNSFRLEPAELPVFDLILLGMGPDGHTASLFPHTPALAETSRLAVANHVAQKDAWRVTLTWPVINHAHSVFFLIAGSDKAQILKDVFTGPRDPERFPSQLIDPESGILTLILDSTAASLLPPPNGDACGVLKRE